MKRTPLLVLAGTVAGFVGVLTFHTRPVSAITPAAQGGGTGSSASPAATPTRPAAGPTQPAAAAGGSAVRSAEGTDVNFNYGVLNIKVTVNGTHITDVSVPNLQTAEPTSQQISEQAIPMLRTEVLQAQSANINGISGATFTSQAYVQSLQAALNKLNIK